MRPVSFRWDKISRQQLFVFCLTRRRCQFRILPVILAVEVVFYWLYPGLTYIKSFYSEHWLWSNFRWHKCTKVLRPVQLPGTPCYAVPILCSWSFKVRDSYPTRHLPLFSPSWKTWERISLPQTLMSVMFRPSVSEEPALVSSMPLSSTRRWHTLFDNGRKPLGQTFTIFCKREQKTI